MTDYNLITLKGRQFAVVGNNTKIFPFTNAFNAQVVYNEGIVPIVATNDAATISGTTGATNVINVLTNDTLNGLQATTGNTILSTVTSNPKLVLNGNGSINVVNPTTGGTYVMTYKICQLDRPTNCDEATVTITVV